MAKLVGMNGVESLVSLLLQQASHAAAANRAAQHRAQLRAEGVSPDSSEGVLAQVRLAQGEHLQLWYAVTALTPHALLREAGELGCSVAGDQSVAQLQDAVFESLLQLAVDDNVPAPGGVRDTPPSPKRKASTPPASPTPAATPSGVAPASPPMTPPANEVGTGHAVSTPSFSGSVVIVSPPTPPPGRRVRLVSGRGLPLTDTPPCLRAGSLFHRTYALPSRMGARTSVYTHVFIEAARRINAE